MWPAPVPSSDSEAEQHKPATSGKQPVTGDDHGAVYPCQSVDDFGIGNRSLLVDFGFERIAFLDLPNRYRLAGANLRVVDPYIDLASRVPAHRGVLGMGWWVAELAVHALEGEISGGQSRHKCADVGL